MSEIDVLNTSWETFQRVINHDPHIYHHRNTEDSNLLSASRLPSFQDIFTYKSPSPIKNSSSEEDSSDSSFFETLFPSSVNVSNPNIKIEEDMIDEIHQPPQFQEPLPMVVFQTPTPVVVCNQNKIKKEVREFLKRDHKDHKEVFEKKKEIEIKIDSSKKFKNKSNNNKNNNSNKLILNKDDVTPITNKGSSKKSDTVRSIWWNNLSQILTNSMIPLKRCLYKFKNPESSPWDTEDGLYIFEIHLLQVLCAKEAWNFKRYVDNHSKKAGEGQTFTLCSSIHKDEWEFLDMKSNKFFKKARMININAFREKNGFITKGKWKYIYAIFQKEFEEQTVNANVNRKK